MVSFGGALQQVASTMDPAALPNAPLQRWQTTPLQLAANGLGEPGVGVRDHQPDAIEARLPGVLELRAGFPPGGLGFAVAHLADQHSRRPFPLTPMATTTALEQT